MSWNIFADIENFASKAAGFLMTVFTKTQQVANVLTKIGPVTLAAILAVFYDVVNFALTESNDLKTGNINDMFSDNTKSLLAKIVADFKAMDSTVVSDLEALGIKKPKAPATTSGTQSGQLQPAATK
jgi:hypothetical protein